MRRNTVYLFEGRYIFGNPTHDRANTRMEKSGSGSGSGFRNPIHDVSEYHSWKLRISSPSLNYLTNVAGKGSRTSGSKCGRTSGSNTATPVDPNVAGKGSRGGVCDPVF
jgi:hypothetical protein